MCDCKHLCWEKGSSGGDMGGVLRNWLMQFWGLVSVKSTGQSGSLEILAGVWRLSRGRILSLCRDSFFFLKSFSWLDESHPRTLWRIICFTQSLLIEMLITSKKNTFTATSRLAFDQTTGCHRLAKLTNKIKSQILLIILFLAL